MRALKLASQALLTAYFVFSSSQAFSFSTKTKGCSNQNLISLTKQTTHLKKFMLNTVPGDGNGTPVCSVPEGMDRIPESLTASQLRSATVTNVKGELVSLDSIMGKGTSIVIFLRHLA